MEVRATGHSWGNLLARAGALATTYWGGAAIAEPVKVGSYVAVAATNAMRKFPERFAGAEHPILVIDLDVHQGNGTAKIFEDDPRVITFSAHGTYPIVMGFVYAQLD